MKAVSLFAGVGGFDLALERNGVEVVATCEIDKHAQKILTRHFPKAKLFSDVTQLTGQDLFDAGFNSDGIIVGGFPCQDVSVAGKRAGLSDSNGNATRSGLFWEVVRLLEETKAQHFILENVPGLLSSNEGRDFGIVLDALVELGYGVSWRILDAQYFGVPQRRRRIFIVGCLGDDGRTLAKILDLLQSSSGDNRQSNQKRQDFTFSTDESVTPYIKVIRSGARAEDGSLPAEVWAERDVSPTLNVMDNTGEARATVLVFASHRVDGARVQHGVATESTVRRLTPTECERLQGFPDGWTKGQADTHRYKQMGNAVAVPVVSWIVNRLMGATNDMD